MVELLFESCIYSLLVYKDKIMAEDSKYITIFFKESRAKMRALIYIFNFKKREIKHILSFVLI